MSKLGDVIRGTLGVDLVVSRVELVCYESMEFGFRLYLHHGT